MHKPLKTIPYGIVPPHTKKKLPPIARLFVPGVWVSVHVGMPTPKRGNLANRRFRIFQYTTSFHKQLGRPLHSPRGLGLFLGGGRATDVSRRGPPCVALHCTAHGYQTDHCCCARSPATRSGRSGRWQCSTPWTASPAATLVVGKAVQA